MTEINFEAMSLTELEDMAQQISNALQRKRAVEEGERRVQQILEQSDIQIDRIATAVHEAHRQELGLAEGQREQWFPPAGLHDSFPKGWVVEHSGYEWESAKHANRAEPTANGGDWKQLQGGIGAPDWAPDVKYDKDPTEVKFEGTNYRMLIKHTSAVGMEPPNRPDLWEPVGGTTSETTTQK